MPWLAVALAIPLFIVAFLFFGSLILGTGSLGSNMREAQQLAMVWSLMAALPMMMMASCSANRTARCARDDLVPVLGRAADHVARQHGSRGLAGGRSPARFVVLLIAPGWRIRVGARLFRVGLLSSSRPKLREILRQARLG